MCARPGIAKRVWVYSVLAGSCLWLFGQATEAQALADGKVSFYCSMMPAPNAFPANGRFDLIAAGDYIATRGHSNHYDASTGSTLNIGVAAGDNIARCTLANLDTRPMLNVEIQMPIEFYEADQTVNYSKKVRQIGRTTYLLHSPMLESGADQSYSFYVASMTDELVEVTQFPTITFQRAGASDRHAAKLPDKAAAAVFGQEILLPSATQYVEAVKSTPTKQFAVSAANH